MLYCISKFAPLRNNATRICLCLRGKEDKPPLMPHSISTSNNRTLQRMRSLFNQGPACKPITMLSHTKLSKLSLQSNAIDLGLIVSAVIVDFGRSNLHPRISECTNRNKKGKRPNRGHSFTLFVLT